MNPTPALGSSYQLMCLHAIYTACVQLHQEIQMAVIAYCEPPEPNGFSQQILR